ncbi:MULTISPECIES: hypothetical protein [Streptomyces]|uniref:hypothetical protein n=1 Tax=Streptomyces TaxID=1883 RepID=UPI0004C9116B|nr:hypothetical protein [Streptomyces sp. NRRL S-15]
MRTSSGEARLLPWTTTGGKPCYLLGDGAGTVSRIADRVESAQLSMAGELLGHAADLLADHRSTGAQVHCLACRLAESLGDVRRVAESRGRRLGDGPGVDDPAER